MIIANNWMIRKPKGRKKGKNDDVEGDGRDDLMGGALRVKGKRLEGCEKVRGLQTGMKKMREKKRKKNVWFEKRARKELRKKGRKECEERKT